MINFYSPVILKKVNDSHFIHCPICNRQLSNPESEIAGIGPVCQKKIRFIQSLADEKLISMATKRKLANDGLDDNRAAIIKKRDGQIGLYNVISKYSENAVVFNRTNYYQEIQSGSSIAKAIADNFEFLAFKDTEFVSSVDDPESPDMQREFNSFKKNYTEDINLRDNLHKEQLEKGFIYYYNPIKTKESMSEAQKIARDDLMRIKEFSPESYNFLWNNGIYQRATVIARLSFFNHTEASKVLNYFTSNEKFKNLKIKDYGLTDDEIMNGLKHSNQKIESMIFSSYINGNRNILLMVAIAEKIPNLDSSLRIKAVKALMNMMNNKKYTKEDLKSDLK
jgi:hypothetical protein